MRRTLQQLVLALSLALTPVPVRSQPHNTTYDTVVQFSEKALFCGKREILNFKPLTEFPRYTLFVDQKRYFVFDDTNNNGIVDTDDSAGFRNGIVASLSSIRYINEHDWSTEGKEVFERLRDITCPGYFGSFYSS